MARRDENVLVVRRSLFDELGSFQGFSADSMRYLNAFLARRNNFFSPRSSAECDPSLKQIISYCILRHRNLVLRYVRGAKSGETRLVAKASVGIGGHINDGDEGLFAFDEATYRGAVEREIREELAIDSGFTDRIVGLINDDSTEVGSVHLGVVHLIELESAQVRAREAAITRLEFVSTEDLRAEAGILETWSRIVIDNWATIAASPELPHCGRSVYAKIPAATMKTQSPTNS